VLAPAPVASIRHVQQAKRHGPLEDYGGRPGFYNLVEALFDPHNDKHEELTDWRGDDFYSETFSVDEVNLRLANLQRRWSRTTTGNRAQKSPH
jgi:hypothetical protein